MFRTLASPPFRERCAKYRFLHGNLDSCTRIGPAASVERELIGLIYRKIRCAAMLWCVGPIRSERKTLHRDIRSLPISTTLDKLAAWRGLRSGSILHRGSQSGTEK